MSNAFPKSARILQKTDFQQLKSRSIRMFGQNLGLQFSKSKRSATRLGITVSKKFGKAHERNRFKRCVRETFRQSLGLLPLGFEINVFPQKQLSLLVWKETCQELKGLLAKIQ